jgi:hypothetical protein
MPLPTSLRDCEPAGLNKNNWDAPQLLHAWLGGFGSNDFPYGNSDLVPQHRPVTRSSEPLDGGKHYHCTKNRHGTSPVLPTLWFRRMGYVNKAHKSNLPLSFNSAGASWG